MALISTKLHGILDYAGGVGSLAAPKLLRDRRAAALMTATGGGTLVTSALTDYELGVVRKLPMRVHLLADAGTGALLLAGAYLLSRSKAKVLDWAPLAVVGITEIAAAALTERQPSDRLREDPLPGATRTPDAPADSRLDEPPAAPPADGDVLAAQEASAAAAEAARIGGAALGSTADDPAMDPVYEAGGGEAEGWEQAEAELIENAAHGDGHGAPERDAFSPELESDRSTAAYGEADAIPSTELQEDRPTRRRRTAREE